MSNAEYSLHSVERVVKKLLFTQNRDTYSKSVGCFDRHYWAWKMSDFPEATYQRNVYTLAWFLNHGDCYKEELKEAVLAGLNFSVKIQHKDGSFDQAFPNEHSFGATAFLLHPLLASLEIIKNYVGENETKHIELALRKSADFLIQHDETHGFISNHIAGAAWSLIFAYQYFSEEKYLLRAKDLIQQILEKQSNEGWFFEYDGADPGYQTLCVYYLAQCQQFLCSDELATALQKSTVFLSHFMHPDGSFAGEYGSRRTGNFYVGGLSILAKECGIAAAMVSEYRIGLHKNRMPGLLEIDMGNLAPLTINYILALENTAQASATKPLPWQSSDLMVNFPDAGIIVRATEQLYTVVGMSSGGTIKCFDKSNRVKLFEELGYVAQLEKGALITTQLNQIPQNISISDNGISFNVKFFEILDQQVTPWKMLILRMLNLSLMSSIYLGNIIKAILVRLLISGKRDTGMELHREVVFKQTGVDINDVVSRTNQKNKAAIKFLERGRKFVGMHMASSRYFTFEKAAQSPVSDVKRLRSDELGNLNKEGKVTVSWGTEL